MGKMYLNGTPYSTEITESRFNYDLLLENTNFTPTTGTSGVTRTYTLNNPIDDYDAVMVFGYLYCISTNKNQIMSMTIMNKDYYTTSAGIDTFLLNGTIDTDISKTQTRRLMFKFTDSTHISTTTGMKLDGEEPRLWKVYGLKFPNETGIKNNDIPIYLGSQVIFPTRIGTSSSSRTNFYCAGVDANNDAQQFNIITRNMTIPTGYEVQYRLSAIFNSQERNTAQLYVNDTLISESGTWASGSGESAYIGHYGNCIMSPLFKFTNITPEQRYIGTQGQMGFNINIRSSVNGQYACIENLTIHAYLVKTYWH